MIQEEIDNRIKSYVDLEKDQKLVREVVRELIRSGYIIMDIDNVAVRTLNRNMDNRAYPLYTILGHEPREGAKCYY